jgi:hypothetical protein
MAGLDPAIHATLRWLCRLVVDGRDKPGHDG